MTVHWSKKAKRKQKAVVRYILSTYGIWSSRAFIEEIEHVVALLSRNPHLGPVEPYLDNMPEIYRSIVVNRLNKIVYYIKDNGIVIADFWDTRREPRTQAGETKEQQ